ncbi:MAG: hypothetical protein E7586_00895 [Ruminococcaceae bacterium]|nr:hypothetical protein [Oscillospiraceae bacterium]
MCKKRVGTVVAVSVLMSFLRTVVIINNMENNYNNYTYYLLDNFQSNSFSVLAVVIIPLLFALGFFYGKGKKPVPQLSDVLNSAASCTLAFVIFGTFIIFAQNCFTKPESLGVFDYLVAFLSVLSVAVFLFAGLEVINRKLLSVLILFPMFFTASRLLCDFLANNSAPFANSGGYHLTGLTFLMLFLFCEGKAYLSIGSAIYFYSFGYIAIFLLSVYAIPNLILHCLGFGVFTFDYSAALSVVDIVFVFYIAARLISAKTVPLKEEETAEKEAGQE